MLQCARVCVCACDRACVRVRALVLPVFFSLSFFRGVERQRLMRRKRPVQSLTRCVVVWSGRRCVMRSQTALALRHRVPAHACGGRLHCIGTHERLRGAASALPRRGAACAAATACAAVTACAAARRAPAGAIGSGGRTAPADLAAIAAAVTATMVTAATVAAAITAAVAATTVAAAVTAVATAVAAVATAAAVAAVPAVAARPAAAPAPG